MARLTPSLRLAIFALGAAAASLTLSGASYAQSCGEDLKKLSEKRAVELNRINGIVKAGKGKPIDPEISAASRPV